MNILPAETELTLMEYCVAGAAALLALHGRFFAIHSAQAGAGHPALVGSPWRG